MARIVIAGCGDVGTALGLRLSQAGHTVWGLRRDPSRLPAGLQPLAADLTEPVTLRALPPALDYMVYAAAAGGSSPAHYRAAYVDGVANILQALQAQGQRLRRLILTSSTSVYGQLDGAWLDEDAPAQASGFGPESLRAGEELVWNSEHPALVIRFGGIYGPGRSRLIDSVRNGRAVCTPGLYTNRIHRDDCAGAIAHLLQLENPAGLYLGVDDEPALQCEVMGWLARQLGVAEPPQKAAAGSAAERRMRANKRCSNTRLRASAYRFRYPSYREGYRALLNSTDVD